MQVQTTQHSGNFENDEYNSQEQQSIHTIVNCLIKMKSEHKYFDSITIFSSYSERKLKVIIDIHFFHFDVVNC